jgi:hypothetical protein
MEIITMKLSSVVRVLEFIRSCKKGAPKEFIEDYFTRGMCYWFAYILKVRFGGEFVTSIVYYPVGRHFACKIDDRFFDITGDITFRNLDFVPAEDYFKYAPKNEVGTMKKIMFLTEN